MTICSDFVLLHPLISINVAEMLNCH